MWLATGPVNEPGEWESQQSLGLILVATTAHPLLSLVQAATWAGRGGGRAPELGCWGKPLPELAFLASTSLVGQLSSLAPSCFFLTQLMGAEKPQRHPLPWVSELQGLFNTNRFASFYASVSLHHI